jgi:hypothetical protein
MHCVADPDVHFARNYHSTGSGKTPRSVDRHSRCCAKDRQPFKNPVSRSGCIPSGQFMRRLLTHPRCRGMLGLVFWYVSRFFEWHCLWENGGRQQRQASSESKNKSVSTLDAGVKTRARTALLRPVFRRLTIAYRSPEDPPTGRATSDGGAIAVSGVCRQEFGWCLARSGHTAPSRNRPCRVSLRSA